MSKQQKEYFLRQQLAAIQRELSTLQRGNANGTAAPSDASTTNSSSELDDDEQHEADDLADLKKRIEAMEPGSEERKMGVREWRRLKRIPQGSVENGVIRSYVGASQNLIDSSLLMSCTARMANRHPLVKYACLIKRRNQGQGVPPEGS